MSCVSCKMLFIMLVPVYCHANSPMLYIRRAVCQRRLHIEFNAMDPIDHQCMPKLLYSSSLNRFHPYSHNSLPTPLDPSITIPQNEPYPTSHPPSSTPSPSSIHTAITPHIHRPVLNNRTQTPPSSSPIHSQSIPRPSVCTGEPRLSMLECWTGEYRGRGDGEDCAEEGEEEERGDEAVALCRVQRSKDRHCSLDVKSLEVVIRRKRVSHLPFVDHLVDFLH